MADSAFFCPLSHEGVLAVRGADAAKFLQGQLTCNLNYLNDTHASLGARCTQKGRMQSSFRIVLQGDGVLLAMASELLEPQLADLKNTPCFPSPSSRTKAPPGSASAWPTLTRQSPAWAWICQPRPTAWRAMKSCWPFASPRPRRTLGARRASRAAAQPTGRNTCRRRSQCLAAGAGARWHRPGHGPDPRAVHPADAQPSGGWWRKFQERLLHRPGNRRPHAIPGQTQAAPVPPEPGWRRIARNKVPHCLPPAITVPSARW